MWQSALFVLDRARPTSRPALLSLGPTASGAGSWPSPTNQSSSPGRASSTPTASWGPRRSPTPAGARQVVEPRQAGVVRRVRERGPRRPVGAGLGADLPATEQPDQRLDPELGAAVAQGPDRDGGRAVGRAGKRRPWGPLRRRVGAALSAAPWPAVHVQPPGGSCPVVDDGRLDGNPRPPARTSLVQEVQLGAEAAGGPSSRPLGLKETCVRPSPSTAIPPSTRRTTVTLRRPLRENRRARPQLPHGFPRSLVFPGLWPRADEAARSRRSSATTSRRLGRSGATLGRSAHAGGGVEVADDVIATTATATVAAQHARRQAVEAIRASRARSVAPPVAGRNRGVELRGLHGRVCVVGGPQSVIAAAACIQGGSRPPSRCLHRSHLLGRLQLYDTALPVNRAVWWRPNE